MKDEMGEICNTNRKNDKCTNILVVKMWRSRLEDLSVDGRVILKWILNKYDLDCLHLAQEVDQWRALVNTEMNIRVP
jgi:hypothetical protein